MSLIQSLIHLQISSESERQNSIASNIEAPQQVQKDSKISKSQEIVKKVIGKEKQEDEEGFLTQKAKPGSVFYRPKEENSYWEEKELKYLEIEESIEDNKDIMPSWEVAGSISYAMSITEIQEVVTQKFRQMVSNGKLMTQKSLANLDRANFYPAEADVRHDLISYCGSNLTRFWGADFINSHLPPQSKIKAADHFFIVYDEQPEIEVRVSFLNDYPCLGIVKNGYILSTRIQGKHDAWSYRYSSDLDRIRYRDFKDSGNIIRDENGTGWIVDTELKGFDAPDIDMSMYEPTQYLKKRFQVLYCQDGNSLYQTIKIPISEIGLLENN